MPKKILCFFGTRPEAIKMAPVIQRLKKRKSFKVTVAVSAQHREMLDQVLKLFQLRSTMDLDLMKEGQSLFDVTTRVLSRFDPILDRIKPDLVLVHGDTTTTLGGALAAYYKKIPVGHVEAGLRTFDKYRPFPEEMNRRLTDDLCTLHFPPTVQSQNNLLKENHSKGSIFVTGNTVIDALRWMVHRKGKVHNAKLRAILESAKRNKNKIILLTAHRRENFGAPFNEIFQGIAQLCQRFPNVEWVYPVHPNPNVKKPARRILGRIRNIHLLPPVDYFDLVQLINRSAIVVTDSGGLQEEAPSLGKPVLVLRDVTERPEAVRAGTVRIVGTKKNKLIHEVTKLLQDSKYYKRMAGAVNPYGDGRAADRISSAIHWYFNRTAQKPRPFGGQK